MSNITFTMSVYVDGLDDMSTDQKCLLLDQIIGKMNRSQITDWIDHGEYGYAVAEGYTKSTYAKAKGE